MSKPKIIIVPGNGNTDIKKENWYAWVAKELKALGHQVIAQNMPDPELARKSIWIPHIKSKLGADENTIIVGHSSGGVAALRFIETYRLLGAVLVGVNHTDLGWKQEQQSGYYDRPWNWSAVKRNADWITLFASQDDPYIPVTEPRFIHSKTDCEYHEYTDRGHFGSEYTPQPTFPELLEVIKRKLS